MRRAAALPLLLIVASCGMHSPKELVVCADPNNLPFSNRAGEGFENRVAALVAGKLGLKLRYVWWAQRRGFVRKTIGEQQCDLWPGVAANLEVLDTTRPYYRSSYMFVTRRSDPLSGLTLDDPRLKDLQLGVQLVGDDGMNTPPAHALARRGLTDHLRGFMLYGDYTKPNPPAAIVDAVAKGEIDVGLVWGPLAGHFAKGANVPLRLEAVTPWLDDTQWPMVYDISMGVRKDEPELKRRIETILANNQDVIGRILAENGVPLL